MAITAADVSQEGNRAKSLNLRFEKLLNLVSYLNSVIEKSTKITHIYLN